MSKPFRNQSQQFRHRGFQDVENDTVVMIYGNDPAPVDSQGKPLKKLWDHDVKQVMQVADHVEKGQ